MHNDDDLSWFLTCGPHCSCPRADDVAYVANSFGGPDHDPREDGPTDDDDWTADDVERLARFAEAGGWEVVS